MRRREFATGSLIFLGAFDAVAQVRRRNIGYLHVGEADQYKEMTAAFTDALKSAGFVQDQNIIINFRWANNDLSRLPDFARELIAIGIDVLVTAGGAPATIAAKAATSTVPIVFSMGEDPVELGIVKSINHPGDNITGSTFLGLALWNKRMELVRDLFPNVTKVALLVDLSSSTVQREMGESAEAAKELKMQPEHFGLKNAEELERTLLQLIATKPDVIVAGSSVLLTRLRSTVIKAVFDARIPLIGTTVGWVRAGAIASIGGRQIDGYQRSGEYVAKILKGASAGDLPVLLPSRFETSINIGVAAKLGYQFSQATLARADEVIE